MQGREQGWEQGWLSCRISVEGADEAKSCLSTLACLKLKKQPGRARTEVVYRDVSLPQMS